MTQNRVKTLFRKLNKAHFSDVLPDIPVVFTDMDAEGLFTCDITTRDKPFSHQMIDGTAKIEINAEFRDRDIAGLLLHEMVHAYFAVVGLAKEGHGKLFSEKCRKIEQLSGVCIPR